MGSEFHAVLILLAQEPNLILIFAGTGAQLLAQGPSIIDWRGPPDLVRARISLRACLGSQRDLTHTRTHLVSISGPDIAQWGADFDTHDPLAGLVGVKI